MTVFKIGIDVEHWPLTHPFVVSRRTTQVTETLRVTLTAEGVSGHGESSGLYYAGETLASMRAQIEGFTRLYGGCFGFDEIQLSMAANGARCAIDCALWDWTAKRTGVPAWKRAGLDAWEPLRTDITISRGSPSAMAEAARRHAGFSMLKLKVGGDGPIEDDLDRIRAVRDAVGPAVAFIVDPNTAWNADGVAHYSDRLHRLGVVLLEQPIAPGLEGILRASDSSVPLCADESLTDGRSLQTLHEVYRVINIKLDKTGGLTEALRLRRAATELGYQLMVGCMGGTSLSIAPGIVAAQGASFVDLDAHFDLVRDRPFGLKTDGETLPLPDPRLWG